MFKTLSKSINYMFVFDLLVLTEITYLVANHFVNVHCDFSIKMISSTMITVTGLYSLFLKGNYKIREFNINLWNIFRLFEGVVFAHIPALLFLSFFITKTELFTFAITNVFAIYIFLLLYRFAFHYYLFKLKKLKKVLIVGSNERAKVIADVINNKYALKMEVINFHQSDTKEKEYNLFSNDIANIITDTGADIVIFTHKSCLVNTLPKKIDSYLMTDFYEKATGKFYIDTESLETYIYDVWKIHHPNCYNESTIYGILNVG